jgi:hypothetical protein
MVASIAGFSSPQSHPLPAPPDGRSSRKSEQDALHRAREDGSLPQAEIQASGLGVLPAVDPGFFF